jgi:plastocyanin
MTKWLAVLCTLLALGLVATGCGSSNKKSSSTSSGGGAKAKAPAKKPAAAATGGKTVKVSMKNIQFSPKSLTVKKGTTVEWTNDESVNHDVTKTGGPGAKFSSGTGNLAQGDTYKQTFNTAGTIKYVCTVHAPGMSGTITVK